ncbi:hypothetical protein KI387_031141, partial [Taxus chinensis]
ARLGGAEVYDAAGKMGAPLARDLSHVTGVTDAPKEKEGNSELNHSQRGLHMVQI